MTIIRWKDGVDFAASRSSLELLQATGIGQHNARQTPYLFGGVFQGTGRLSFEEIHVGKEVMWTTATLQAGNQLQENAIDAIRNAVLLPLHFPWMLLALIQQQRF